MTNIDRAELDRAVADKLVRAKPRGTLCLYDYTERCQYERAWTPTTEQARGLVLDAGGNVVALPYAKFFNLNERPSTTLESLLMFGYAPDMAEKLDGSLIIAFSDPERGGRWTTNTRGSWEAWQALRAQEILTASGFRGDPAVTYLFELVGPTNRVVVAYDRERLVLTGARRNADGHDFALADVAEMGRELGVETVKFSKQWPGDVDLKQGVKNAEGYVARYDSGFRVKLKFTEYVRIHKIVTGLSVLGVWERLAAGNTELEPGLPDEFMAWHRTVSGALREKFAGLREQVNAEWNAKDWRAIPRKDCAAHWATLPSEIKASLFARMDRKPEDHIVWRNIRPTPEDATKFFGEIV